MISNATYYLYYTYSVNNDPRSSGTSVVVTSPANVGEIIDVNGRYYRVISRKPAHPTRLYIEPAEPKDFFINLSGGVIDLRGGI